MHLQAVADRAPERAAVIMGGSGDTITFRELDERANRLGRLFRSRGLQRGDSILVMMENNPRFFEVVWAAQRNGLYYTTVNSHLTPGEVAYIVNDSGARFVVSSAALGEIAAHIDAQIAPLLANRLMVDGLVEGWESYEEAISAEEPLPRGDECEGDFLLYSSGTTGNPKGIRRPLQYLPMGQGFAGA